MIVKTIGSGDRICTCYNKSIRHGSCESCDVATVEPACANHVNRDNKINHDWWSLKS